MVRVSKLIEQLSSSGVIVFVVSHDFEFIVRTCTEVVQLDDDGAIQNQRLSPEILKTLSEKYLSMQGLIRRGFMQQRPSCWSAS